MSTKNIILLLLVAILILFPLILWLSIPAPIEIIQLPVTVKVDDMPAFALTDEPILRLGTITPGGPGNIRGFNLSNNNDFQTRVVISYEGLEWLYLSETEFLMEPGEIKKINATARAPNDAEHGSYEWNLIIRIFKA